MKGSARQAVLEIDSDVLSSDNGLQAVINKLNGLYLKDVNQRIYVALKSFEKYQRPADDSIDNYLNKFDLMYNRLKSHKIILPDPVLAYRLLESANLEKTKSDLVRATITRMSFDEMKTQLRKLEDIAITSGDNVSFEVKDEPDDVLYTRSFSNRRGNHSRGRGWNSRGSHGGVGRGSSDSANSDRSGSRGSRGSYNTSRGRGGRNRGGRGGGFRRGVCHVCKSNEHYIDSCPFVNHDQLAELGEEIKENLEEEVEIIDVEI